MKKQKVIATKNFGARSPILMTAVAYLFLDKFNAVGWVWGVVATLFVILWIGYFVTLATSDPVDIFEDKKPT